MRTQVLQWAKAHPAHVQGLHALPPAQLQGCRVITTISMMHVGSFDEGLIVLRNTALRINANRMIPLRLVDSAHTRVPHRFRAKMIRCPEESEV